MLWVLRIQNLESRVQGPQYLGLRIKKPARCSHSAVIQALVHALRCLDLWCSKLCDSTQFESLEDVPGTS